MKGCSRFGGCSRSNVGSGSCGSCKSYGIAIAVVLLIAFMELLI